MNGAPLRRRVVTIVSSYFSPHVGGVETMAMEHACGLQALGWDAEVVTTRLKGDPAVEEIRGVRVRRHHAPNPFERRFHVPIPLVPPTLMRSIVRPGRRPDVIVAHGHVYISSLWAAVAARRHRVPLVVLQSNPFVEYPRIVEWVERAADATLGRVMLERSAVVPCISKHTQDYVARIAPRARTTIVPCGVDTTRFAPDRSAARSTRIVTLRRLVDRNGVDVLIDAWRLSELDDRAELVIGGTGPEAERLHERARGLSNVRLVGFVPDDALADFYRSARLAVMPTRTGEGFGLMAAEAMACGTPVVATDQGALPEIVHHGINGLLVPPDDPDAMASTLVKIFTDDGLHARLSAGARATDLSWDTSCARLDDVLRVAVGSEN